MGIPRTVRKMTSHLKFLMFHACFMFAKQSNHPIHNYNWDLTPSDLKVFLNFRLLSKGKNKTRLRRQMLPIPKYDFQVVLNSGRDAGILKCNFLKKYKHVYSRGHRSWKIFWKKLSMNHPSKLTLFSVHCTKTTWFIWHADFFTHM